MIRHLVGLRFRPGTTQTTKEALYADLAALSSRIDGILDFQSRANVSVEDQTGAAVAFGLAGAILSIDPARFAEALSSGVSATLTVSYMVTDGQGGATPNTATLIIDGLTDLNDAAQKVVAAAA